MTLWLTLLLIWTTGIPLVVILGAALAAHVQDRRVTRLVRYAESPGGRAVQQTCGRRARAHNVPAPQRPRRRRVQERRPA
jgi:hypothetical protein